MFQRRLRKRFAPRREIELSETFAWIPQTLRRIFLHQTGRERHAFAGRFEQRIELPQRDRALLARAEIKRMIFAHAGVAFALASLTRGALVELLHVSIEDANFFRARELRAGRRRPRTFVPTGKNQVGTVLILRLRHGEQLHARVRMIARGRTRGAKRRSRFFKPTPEEGARKFRIEALRPIARNAGNFERVLLPAEIRERGVSLFEKL